MTIVNQDQFEAWNHSRLGEVDEVRDGVWAVPLPLPIKGLPWVFSYFILDDGGDLHLVDAGWDTDDSWGVLTAAIGRIGKTLDDVRSVTATHFHPDHLGMAGRIRSATGARVALLQAEQNALHTLAVPGSLDRSHERDMARWGVPAELWPELTAQQTTGAEFGPFEADVVLVDGELLKIPGREIRAVATPGHTIGELSLHDADAGILYSGDHLLPNQFPGIGLGGPGPNNPIADYLGSLDRVAALGDIEVAPGHGWRFTGLQQRVDETRAHHLTRSAEIAAILDGAGHLSVWDVASRVTWTSGWENLRPVERLSALRQSALHVDYLEARPASPIA